MSYERHNITGIPLLRADENLIETLEDNQVSLRGKNDILTPFRAELCSLGNIEIFAIFNGLYIQVARLFPPLGAASEHLDEQVRGVLPSRGEQLAKETDGG